MDIKNKKVLITGGAGYIGSHVVNELLKYNYKVTVIDRYSFDKESLDTLKKNRNLEIIKGDIRDDKIIRKNIRDVDTVIHLAALVGEAACNISEKETTSINLESTKNLCKISKEHNVKKFIFMSTASSYGVQDVNEIANESTKLNPVSLYAKSKIECENILLNEFSDFIDITIFRPSTVYGDSLRMRFDLILNHIILDAFNKNEIKVFGPKMWRPLMWVGEPARVFKKIIDDENSKFKSQVFNLGYNKENYQKIEVAEMVQKNFFKDIKLEIIDKDPDLRSYKLNFDKMKKFFELSPKTSLKTEAEGIKDKLDKKLYGDTTLKKYYNV